ncbi:hypothetical protein DFH06DRAFT_141771 [Mycena polygramma]|nr:hypothetical protein DFH06DRAFT_141771 [Mycena polygramma]
MDAMDAALTKVIHCGNYPPTDLQSQEIRRMLAAMNSEVSHLDTTILKLSLVLSELQCQRLTAHKAAMAVQGALSPIRRIPPEIVSHIFVLCRNNSMRSRYSIANPRNAPIVLGQVSSRWRSICHGTPLLWDQFHLTAGSGIHLPHAETLLARSTNFPLSVRVTRSHPASRLALDPEPVLGLCLGLHARLKAITLDIRPSHLSPPHNLHQNTVFPILTSLQITFVDTDGGPDIASALSTFSKAPCLRTVSLKSNCPPQDSHSLTDTLPWSQLTELALQVLFSLRDAQIILSLCPRLQTARISDCIWSADSVERPVQLPELQVFSFRLRDSRAPTAFFEAFSFPNLQDLVIDAYGWSPLILPELYDRSTFRLGRLVLRKCSMPSNDLLELLRRFPTLRELTLHLCWLDVEFSNIFTIDPGSTSHRLTLPHLQRLCVNDFADIFEGTSVADMAESLCLHRRKPASAFPALRSVVLSLQGRKFDRDVERRLAAACSTGLIVDRSERTE